MGLAMSVLLAGIVGCGGTLDPEPALGADMAKTSSSDDMTQSSGAGGGDMALLPLFSACTENAQCASMLCSQASYDRSPTPLCTYACDPTTDTNPLCPNGCNPKFFCKMPN
ncbi:MAG TPA: hypothetical protein VHB97_02015, partial [Polyangia bacterium]|nr:hypothetical protein [Polyangia bacterium]